MRHVLAKKHASRNDDGLPEGRTLFLTSLDDFLTESVLKKALDVFGKVETITLKRTVRVNKKNEREVLVLAHIVFKNHGVVDKVLSEEALDGECVLGLPAGGRKLWAKQAAAKVREPSELQAEVDRWMEEYERQEAEEARRAAEPEVDDDGFTKVKGPVTRFGNDDEGLYVRSFKPPQVSTGAFSIDSQAQDGKKKKKVLPLADDFYKFQWTMKKREEVRDQLVQKRKDVEAVESMRRAKKFKKLVAE